MTIYISYINLWKIKQPGFIDYFPIDNNKIAIALGDVMGKKWGAWYFAVAYAGYVRSALRFVLQSDKNLSPGEIIKKDCTE